VESSAPSKKVISMLDKCVDAAVKKTFRVSSSDNCAFIRTCLGLYHIEDFVRERTAKFMYNRVTEQFPNDVVQIDLSELFDFNDFNN